MINKDSWKSLEEQLQNKSGQGLLKRLFASHRGCDFYLAIQMPGLERALLIEMPREFIPLPDAIPSSRGFQYNVEITGREIVKDHASLILTTNREDYNEIFAAIADDIYSKASEATDEKKLARVLINRLALWQRFFDRQSEIGLSDNAQTGLYGELYLLYNHLLSSNLDVDKTILMWTGPEKRQHDFQMADLVIEVKTSTARQHQKIHVSNELQLESTENTKLYLYFLSVALIENSTNTLPVLIASLRRILAGHETALNNFNNRLIASGYLDSQQDLYSHRGYQVRDDHFFLVTEGFPRILEKQMPVGTGDLEYTIAVSACHPFKVNRENILDIIRARHE